MVNSEPRHLKWQKQYQKLVDFYQQHGHCNVSRKTDKTLAYWVNTQRAFYRQGKLKSERIQQLNALSFDWTPYRLATVDGKRVRPTWEEQYEELKRFKLEYGHCRVPSYYRGDESKLHLGNWVSTQKQCYSEGKLSAEKITLLENIGFQWAIPRQWTWEDRYQQLKDYQSKYGSCNVSTSHTEYRDLALWLFTQRSSRRNGTLSAHRELQLSQLGVEWSLRNSKKHIKTNWMTQYEQLKQYKEQYGHADVPISFRGDEDKGHLGNWVRNQRKAFLTGILPKDKYFLLHQLGFNWDMNSIWETQFHLLTEFVSQHGHADVLVEPTDTPNLHYLEKWLQRQRAAKQRGDLDPLKEQRLTELGVEWNFNRRWETQYRRLQAFHQQYGHADVPISYGRYGQHSSEITPLGTWVSNQRRAYRKGVLASYKIDKLNRLNFKWSVRATTINTCKLD